MANPVPYSPPFLASGIFRGHFRILGEGATIQTPETATLPFQHLITDIKTVTGGTEQGADTTTNALGRYSLPVILVLKDG